MKFKFGIVTIIRVALITVTMSIYNMFKSFPHKTSKLITKEIGLEEVR